MCQLTGLFQFTVRLASETEARFTSVERIHHYIQVSLPLALPLTPKPLAGPTLGQVLLSFGRIKIPPN